MYRRPPDLPQFEDPPVQHVRLEMVYEPLQIQSIALRHLIDIWHDRYPEVSELAPKPVEVEAGGSPGFRIEIADKPRIPLIRFAGGDNSRWIEVQADRFSCGWSKGSGGEYPRYESLRDEFDILLREFADFVSDAEIQVVNLALTYMNEFSCDGEDPVSGLGWAYFAEPIRAPVQPTEARLEYDLPQSDGESVWAVLRVKASVRRVNGDLRSRLRLRFSGDPFKFPLENESEDALDYLFAFFDRGHEQIVRTFADVTSRELHERWERKQ
jgi:uncharacterized protein (TIGR04255 family)